MFILCFSSFAVATDYLMNCPEFDTGQIPRQQQKQHKTEKWEKEQEASNICQNTEAATLAYHKAFLILIFSVPMSIYFTEHLSAQRSNTEQEQH